jgi:hypothetical protein
LSLRFSCADLLFDRLAFPSSCHFGIISNRTPRPRS